MSVWFKPLKTAEWAKYSKPLYGVVTILVLYALVAVLSNNMDLLTGASATPAAPAPKKLTGMQQIAAAFDTYLMPFLLVASMYFVGRYLGGRADIKNIVWVMVWSQLPVVLLSLLTIGMELLGLKIGAPLLDNKITFIGAFPVLEPQEPILNMHGLIYFVVSTVLLLWSFQIMLSGMAGVQGVTTKRAIWFVVGAMLLLMLISLPITLILDNWNILDVLGLQGIVELKE